MAGSKSSTSPTDPREALKSLIRSRYDSSLGIERILPYEGDWSALTGDEAASVLIEASVALVKKGEEAWPLAAKRLYAWGCRIPGYLATVVHIDVWLEIDEGRFCQLNLLVSQKGVTVVEDAQTLHSFSETIPIQISTPEEACGYVPFFTWIVMTEEGPFRFLGARDEHLLPQEDFKRMGFEVKAAAADADEFEVTGYVLYGQAVIETAFRTDRMGNVKMEKDMLLAMLDRPTQVWRATRSLRCLAAGKDQTDA